MHTFFSRSLANLSRLISVSFLQSFSWTIVPNAFVQSVRARYNGFRYDTNLHERQKFSPSCMCPLYNLFDRLISWSTFYDQMVDDREENSHQTSEPSMCQFEWENLRWKMIFALLLLSDFCYGETTVFDLGLESTAVGWQL